MDLQCHRQNNFSQSQRRTTHVHVAGLNKVRLITYICTR
jgi:hypothetical protein